VFRSIVIGERDASFIKEARIPRVVEPQLKAICRGVDAISLNTADRGSEAVGVEKTIAIPISQELASNIRIHIMASIQRITRLTDGYLTCDISGTFDTSASA
jgi:hypothetical protein